MHLILFKALKHFHLDLNNIKSYLKRKKPNILIHLAGLSRPMEEHERKIQKSIDLNIIGNAKFEIVLRCLTSNVMRFLFLHEA